MNPPKWLLLYRGRAVPFEMVPSLGLHKEAGASGIFPRPPDHAQGPRFFPWAFECMENANRGGGTGLVIVSFSIMIGLLNPKF